MTLRQLEIFRAIVDTEGFTSAAQRLFMAQPSVSQQMRLLEQELGIQLILRLKDRKVHLTEAGERLKARADAILEQCEAARREMAGLSTEPAGRIRIGIGAHPLFSSLLAPVLSTLRQRFSRVSINVVNGTTPELVEMLEANRLDLAIVTLPISAKSLRTHVLFTDELVLIVRHSDPLSSRGSIDAAKLPAIPLVLYDRTTQMRRLLESFFEKHGIQPNVVMEAASVATMIQFVEAGLGAAIVPSSHLLDLNDRLSIVKLKGRPLTRDVGLAMPKVASAPKVLDPLLRLLKKNVEAINQQLGNVSSTVKRS